MSDTTEQERPDEERTTETTTTETTTERTEEAEPEVDTEGMGEPEHERGRE